MLTRFCLYGFLKNQQYYAPFIVLALREKGLTFFHIGLLIAVREVVRNVLEIPSGAAADVWGRRRAMMVSFVSYIASFVLLGWGTSLSILSVAMVLFGTGDAFRTGTHKAMILHWLRRQNRLDERTRIYGITRSWSRLGSAVSAAIAAAMVFVSGRYSTVFYWTTLPYVAGLVNFLGYPTYLDGEGEGGGQRQSLLAHLTESARQIRRDRGLRRLLLETMGSDGIYDSVKDYLQPLLKQTALLLPVALTLAAEKRSALLIGVVYTIFHLLESLASRKAHLLSKGCADEECAARRLWMARLVLYASLAPALIFASPVPAIGAFVCLGVVHNLWRPIQVSRIQAVAPPERSATILSVDSQAKTFATMILAPIIGLAVDHLGLWPVGGMGTLVCLVTFLSTRRRSVGSLPCAKPPTIVQ